MQNVTKTSDCVQVVRCKDCDEWYAACGTPDDGNDHFCMALELWTKPVFYCADGVRREYGVVIEDTIKEWQKEYVFICLYNPIIDQPPPTELCKSNNGCMSCPYAMRRPKEN